MNFRNFREMTGQVCPLPFITPETAAASGSSEGSTLSSHGPGAGNPASTAMQRPAPFDGNGMRITRNLRCWPESTSGMI